MNVVPLLGNAIIAKSNIHDISPMIVPFVAMSSFNGGNATIVVSEVTLLTYASISVGTRFFL